jgi:hypothetical protein
VASFRGSLLAVGGRGVLSGEWLEMQGIVPRHRFGHF